MTNPARFVVPIPITKEAPTANNVTADGEPECDERMRGVTDEPTFCSICLEDLTGIVLADGINVSEILR